MLRKLGLVLVLLATIGMSAAFAQKTENAKPTKEEVAKVAKYFATVKQTYYKNPKSASAIKELAETGNTYAEMIMKADWIEPKQMYPHALKIFRVVKQADPKNEKATRWIKTIEDIYRSMGRPIPK
ncbi:MAG: hypothetical protein KF784_06725 [Fimbriimonadaceae bacterium]|nr:hypothetical protein [Fimbriimonadaceae bacterium]